MPAAWDASLAEAIIEGLGAGRPGAADPARPAGSPRHVPEAAIPMMAQALNISRAEAHGVVTFITISATPRPASGWSRSAAPRPASRSAASRRAKRCCGCWASTGAAPRRMARSPSRRFIAWALRGGASALIDGEPVGRLDARKLARVVTEGVA